jgi:hypothetical protein
MEGNHSWIIGTQQTAMIAQYPFQMLLPLSEHCKYSGASLAAQKCTRFREQNVSSVFLII